MTTVPPDNSFLLQQVAQGDEAAFTRLVIAWQPVLANHIYRITESRELTEEIVQDVFLKIWQTRETLTGIEYFKAYLLTVSRNHALNTLRKVATHLRHVTSYLKDNPDAEYPDPASPYYSLLDEAIDQLPEHQKKAFLLHRHLKHTYQEIADMLSTSAPSAKYQVEEAIKGIHRYIQGKLGMAIMLLLLHH